jgi:glycyl-tRNA synthetase
MSSQPLFEKITEIAKRRGFYWPSFEIYGGLGGFMTYGDYGTKLKRNIGNLWRENFVRQQGFQDIDAPIINPHKVFEASGHLENFKEYNSECSQCGRSFRTDHLIEEVTGLENVEAFGVEEISRLLVERDIRCLVCGGSLKDPAMFLTMFGTQIGSRGGEEGYTRPETAQGMFINFRRGYLIAREKLPFALVQTGKVLRNEISPRRGVIRLREFTIMELELFFDPCNPECPWLESVKDMDVRLFTEEMEKMGEEKPLEIKIHDGLEEEHILTEWQAYFMGLSQNFIASIGVKPKDQRFRAHLPEERAHYSAQTYDHEVKLDAWGWIEVSGHAYRTDYDLRAHQNGSGEDMSILREDGSRLLPHVVEPSYGLDRLVYVTMETNYSRKNKRNIFSFPRELSPYQLSLLPLVTRDGLPEKTREVERILQMEGFTIYYDERGSIGRRYARSDEVGTPLAITIDYDTLEKNTITIRDRDSWLQVTQEIDDLPRVLQSYFKRKYNFSDLGEPLER